MRLKATLLGLIAVLSTYTILAQEPSQTVPRDDAYVSPHRPSTTLTAQDVPIKDDALGRIDWMREVMGGDLTPEFMEAMMIAADAQRRSTGRTVAAPLKSRPEVRGPTSAQTDPTGSRTACRCRNPIPAVCGRSSCIQRNPDMVYVLTSSGGSVEDDQLQRIRAPRGVR